MITGEEIYNIALEHFSEAGLERVEWKDATYMHEFYEDIARQLNVAHLLPLQKLADTLRERQTAVQP